MLFPVVADVRKFLQTGFILVNAILALSSPQAVQGLSLAPRRESIGRNVINSVVSCAGMLHHGSDSCNESQASREPHGTGGAAPLPTPAPTSVPAPAPPSAGGPDLSPEIPEISPSFGASTTATPGTLPSSGIAGSIPTTSANTWRGEPEPTGHTPSQPAPATTPPLASLPQGAHSTGGSTNSKTPRPHTPTSFTTDPTISTPSNHAMSDSAVARTNTTPSVLLLSSAAASATRPSQGHSNKTAPSSATSGSSARSNPTTAPVAHTISTSITPSPSDSSSHSPPHIGAIIGGILGGLVSAFLLAGVCVRVSRRRHRGGREGWMETASAPASPHSAHCSTDSVEWNARLDNTIYRTELERSGAQPNRNEDDMDFRCAESIVSFSAEYPETETETQAQRRRAEILSEIRAALASVRT